MHNFSADAVRKVVSRPFCTRAMPLEGFKLPIKRDERVSKRPKADHTVAGRAARRVRGRLSRLTSKSCASAARRWRRRPVDRWLVVRSWLVVLSFVLVAACAAAAQPGATPTRTLGPGEQWVPAMPPADVLCAGPREIGGAALVLTGSPDDPRVAWMLRLGQQLELRWPVGYSARFTPKLELMDENDKVVGREGDVALGGCETSPGVWSIELPGQVPTSTDYLPAEPQILPPR